MAAEHAAALRFLERGAGGYRTENIKQRRVGRYLKIEIEQAMHENSHAAKQRRHGQRAARSFRPILKLGRSPAEDDYQKPDRNRESHHSCLDQQSQIVIVCLVDEKSSVKTTELRVDGGKGAKSPVADRVVVVETVAPLTGVRSTLDR